MTRWKNTDRTSRPNAIAVRAPKYTAVIVLAAKERLGLDLLHPAQQRVERFVGFLEQVVVADAPADPGFEFVTGPLGGYQDRAGGGVAAVECSLGTLQHLDLFHVEQFAVKSIGVGDQHAVDHIGK